MPRILIECSNVFRSPNVNTGIQRVVRNIVRNLEEVSRQEAVICIPVVIAEGRLFKVERLLPDASDLKLLPKSFLWFERVNHALWGLHGRLECRWNIRRWHNARRALFVAFRLLTAPLWVSMRLLRVLGYDSLRRRATAFEHQPGDQLVLLDSSWHSSVFATVESLKRDGVGIVAVVHDLIPLLRPELSDDRLHAIFTSWFDWISTQADGFVAVSRSVRDHVVQEITKRFGEKEAVTRWYGFFYHGCELDLACAESSVPNALAESFSSGNIYLAVGTIEPRKNHEYLLDAFELAWASGSDACLCIVGRIGWKRDALIRRIREHVEFGRHLFMFNDISDSGLQYAYDHARALVFASHDEGFGLPLVEAMQRGLPVMGSDIPVFHEIGSEYIAYFDLQRPQSLVDLIFEYDRSADFPAPRRISEWRWHNWSEASRQLVHAVLIQGNDNQELRSDCNQCELH